MFYYIYFYKYCYQAENWAGFIRLLYYSSSTKLIKRTFLLKNRANIHILERKKLRSRKSLML